MSTEPLNDRRQRERENWLSVCEKRGICPVCSETIKKCCCEKG